MDFFLGGVTGFMCGFGLLYIQYHKYEVNHSIAAIKDDISALHAKIDKVLSQFAK